MGYPITSKNLFHGNPGNFLVEKDRVIGYFLLYTAYMEISEISWIKGLRRLTRTDHIVWDLNTQIPPTFFKH